MQQRYGLQERQSVSLVLPSSGHAEPDVPLGVLSPPRTSEGKLHLRTGYETKALRDRFGLKKTSQKSKPVFAAHAADAWVMAADVSGAELPTEQGLYYWTPIRLHRRQLHRLQPEKGGIRKPYGGTRSLWLTRGTLVRHIKYGLTYIGGTLKGKVSLHGAVTGKRVTQSAKVEECTPLTCIAWRTQQYAGIGRRHSSPG